MIVLHGAFLASVSLAAAPTGKFAKQLAEECDALMQAAVRRPYGWGWDTVAAPSRGTAPRHIAMEPLGTPAAGLILLWAGDLLDEPKYRQAALEAARGIAASQMPVGKIPLHAMFAATPGGRDEPSTVPERAATRASLVLMLSIKDSIGDQSPELLARSAQRAAQWLIKQQADDGSWPIAYSLKREEEDKSDIVRIIRLDNSEYRDDTYAMLLVSQSLTDPPILRSVGKSVLKLINLRLGAPPVLPSTQEAKGDLPTTRESELETEPLASVLSDDTGADHRTNNLWSTAYRLSGVIDTNLTEFPAAADVISSRYAMQALLGAYLINGERQSGLALDAAMQALTRLRDADGHWQRKYVRIPTTAPATQETQDFFGPRAAVAKAGDFGATATLAAVRQLKSIGRERYKALAGNHFTLNQQLSASVCGLMDNPFTLELPISKSEVDNYLKQHATDFAILNGPIPETLQPRLNRLWMLLIRAKLEQKQGG